MNSRKNKTFLLTIASKQHLVSWPPRYPARPDIKERFFYSLLNDTVCSAIIDWTTYPVRGVGFEDKKRPRFVRRQAQPLCAILLFHIDLLQRTLQIG